MRRVTDLDGETRVVGVIGWPVRHSLSPPMQNAALEQLGLNWVYVPWEVSPLRLPEAIAAIRALDLKGINVTVPHKAAAALLVDELGKNAGALGVVNTIVNRDGKLFGYNTDAEGFLRALREIGETATAKRVVVLGAGGAARAVTCALARETPAELVILNRTMEKALELATLVESLSDCPVRFVGLHTPEAEAVVRQADLVVNGTSIGMYPHADDEPIVPVQWLGTHQIVCDLVYTPRQTRLLVGAAERGAKIMDGTGMLVHQGAVALELWTGMPAPIEVMRTALHAALEARKH